MALNLLSAIPEHRTDSFLVIRYLKHLEIDCLDLAIACECEKFVSSLTIQNILDKMWIGYDDNETLESVKVYYYNLQYTFLNSNFKYNSIETELIKWQQYYNNGFISSQANKIGYPCLNFYFHLV